ncbi:hypothetical protein [Facilibium subflavum]|uniref:hypothetical protein n=1 Tax=Facilibium subflavum TaxID=2219058 RepID=UPI000E6515CA|nr:hypothetical protein [Facilibium subflavum]
MNLKTIFICLVLIFCSSVYITYANVHHKSTDQTGQQLPDNFNLSQPNKTDTTIKVQNNWVKSVDYHAAIWFLAQKIKLDDKQAQSDYSMPYAIFTGNIQSRYHLSLHMYAKHFEHVTPITPGLGFREFYIKYAPTKKINILAGKDVLPFGSFHSYLFEQPLTKKFAITLHNTILANLNLANWHFSTYLFKPSQRYIANNQLGLGARMQYQIKYQDNNKIMLGMDYTSSLTDAALFQYNLGFGGLQTTPLKKRLGGFATYLHAYWHQNYVLLSYIGSIHRSQPGEFGLDHPGYLGAYDTEIGHIFSINGHSLIYSAGFSGGMNLIGLGLPQYMFTTGLKYRLNKHVALYAGYLYNQFYAKNSASAQYNKHYRALLGKYSQSILVAVNLFI